ncbi:hypothetical protein BKA66DRAFT_414978 [Pyrenochaeta sp. MPI-SDFR-AT-0127]|nr:hypothetical protein BKA66DRAFT_414978 [Pyrenochaeta sp. MPI-SDFR-AT-0127]
MGETNLAPEATVSQVEQHSPPSGSRSWVLSDATKRSSQQSGRSRPLSSIYDDRRTSNPPATQSSASDYKHSEVSDSTDGSIANDYKSYLPVLSGVDDSYDGHHMTLSGDRRRIGGASDGRYEEDVADRNIERYSASVNEGQMKPLPALPSPCTTNRDSTYHSESPRNLVNSAGSFGSTIRSVPSEGSSGKYAVGSDNNATRSISDEYITRQSVTVKPQGLLSGNQTITSKGTHGSTGSHNPITTEDWKLQQQMLLSGVVDLSKTVDTDRHTQWAPAVTHEIVKPHEHEIIQHKIYREIHNYSYYHRLQPVLHTEVLPPRRFIPNPHGQGLIEISADELPARTGKNRWWDIVQKEIPDPFTMDTQYQWRTEPEIIEGRPYITDEGFERRETTILYPPTLEDMSDYGGVVQPVHFDHKTGERWLGEMTTMDKLREQLQHMNVNEETPEAPPSPAIKRKPVNGVVNGAASVNTDRRLNGVTTA